MTDKMPSLKPLGLIFAAAMIVNSAFAAGPDLSKLPPSSTKTDLTYEKDIQPIFKESCYGCHGPERQKGGLRLDTLEGALKGSHDGKVIVPTKGEKSSLLIAVARLNERDAMPPIPRGPRPGGPGGTNSPNGQRPAPKPLTAEQVGLIRAWIDQGAK